MNGNRIKFTYLYRDGANYKAWGEVVFDNPDNMPLADIDLRLRNAFETDGLFIAHQVRIPEVFLYRDGGLTKHDHCYHEFFGVEQTEAEATDEWARSIAAFVAEAEREGKLGWKAFEPVERMRVE